jgi:hypothetical protein
VCVCVCVCVCVYVRVCVCARARVRARARVCVPGCVRTCVFVLALWCLTCGCQGLPLSRVLRSVVGGILTAFTCGMQGTATRGG